MKRFIVVTVLSLVVVVVGLRWLRGHHPADAPALAAGDSSADGIKDRAPDSSGPGTDSKSAKKDAWRKSKGRVDPSDEEDDVRPAFLPWVEVLLSGEGPRPLTAEELDHWFTTGHTNAGDLLAARQAGQDARFLTNALEQFPNDPRVLMAATILRDGPDAHRERLERFKAAAPENALADYLSAWNEFNAGNPEKALENLRAATGKKGFDDYVLDAMQNAEALYLDAGKSPAEATMAGSSGALLPHLAHLKKISDSLAELQGQAIAAGNAESAAQLAGIGVQLGEHLTKGAGSRTLIGELVGMAIQKAVVKSLPPEANQEFLQGDPATYLARIDERRAAVRESTQSVESWMRTANETEIIGYFERFKADGESAALAWLREQNTALKPTAP